MNISKPDALFLHSLLFHVLTKELGTDVTERVHALMDDIQDFLTDSEHSIDDHHDDDDDDESIEEIDHHVLASDLHELPEIVVSRADGTTAKMEFEQVEDVVDLLLDGDVLVENVGHITVDGNNISIRSWDDDNSHDFVASKRLTKKWKAVLPDGVSEVTDVNEDEDEDEEDE